MSSRKGRFSHQLFSEKEWSLHWPILQELINPFVELWQQKKISDSELCSSFILLANGQRRPKDFLGGLSPFRATERNLSGYAKKGGIPINVDEWLDFLPQEWEPKKRIQNCWVLRKRVFAHWSFQEFFCGHLHRSIPIGVNRVLLDWNRGTFPLVLCFYIPSSLEVFEMQIRGTRCVSLLVDFEKYSIFNNHRDPLSFLIHDLLHAEKFFSNPELVAEQIHFLKNVRLNLNSGDFYNLMDNGKFREGLEYLISDMNSHPAHMESTLRALVCIALNESGDGVQFAERWTGITLRWKPNFEKIDQSLELEIEGGRVPCL